jgi:phosphoenolpyruvate carboxykinase (ATP)
MFMRNMLIVPTEEELKRDFVDNIDFYIFNAGEMAAPAHSLIKGVGKNKCCVAVNLSEKKMVILGTQYAGEMKKGIFGVMHYFMPKLGVLSLHASANEGMKGDTTLLFGLSGTGKTTLSADPKRRLIGDDEHCWTPDGIFNIEGGCYAKCIGLTEEKEPEIYRALKYF